MPDPYQTLGVSRTASEAEIKRAYRKLANQHHPDLAPGDRRQAERFREISAAYEILRDPNRRAVFDRTGSTEPPGRAGQSGFGQSGFGPGGFGPWGKTWRGNRAGFSAEEAFADLFGFRAQAQGQAQRGAGPRERAADVRVTLNVDFLTAIHGGSHAVALPNGKRIDVRIPPGLRDGQVLRLRGQGERASALRGGEPGDALVTVRVEPHPEFRRDGDDIHIDLPITLPEAVLGTKANVATVDGPVTVTVPAGSNGTKPLRLRGRGAADAQGRRGDQYVFLRIVLPDDPDPELDAFVRRWAAAHPYDARRRTAKT